MNKQRAAILALTDVCESAYRTVAESKGSDFPILLDCRCQGKMNESYYLKASKTLLIGVNLTVDTTCTTTPDIYTDM